MTTPLRFLMPLFVSVLVACGGTAREESEPTVGETSQEVTTTCSSASPTECRGATFGTVCQQTGTCELNPNLQQYFPGACSCYGGVPPTCPSTSRDGCGGLLSGSACVKSTGAAGTCSFVPSKYSPSYCACY